MRWVYMYELFYTAVLLTIDTLYYPVPVYLDVYHSRPDRYVKTAHSVNHGRGLCVTTVASIVKYR